MNAYEEAYTSVKAASDSNASLYSSCISDYNTCATDYNSLLERSKRVAKKLRAKIRKLQRG
ncbi:MAG: hypothetical protein KDH96_09115 [Candidatus Riesia sp.]|nr:hypothetical protein [Candidatus Riesia sp.]